jgi:hypothetical protein
MSKDYTTIRVTQAAKDRAEQSKHDDETWSDYIERCTDNPPEIKQFVEAATTNDANNTTTDNTLDYDDIVQAVRKGIREELPEGALR